MNANCITTSTPNHYCKQSTRRVPLVGQELRTLPEHSSSPPVFSGVRVFPLYHTHDTPNHYTTDHHRCRLRSILWFVHRCLSFFFWSLCSTICYTTDVVFHDLPYSRYAKPLLSFSTITILTTSTPNHLSFSTIYHTHDEYAKPLHHRCRFPRHTHDEYAKPLHHRCRFPRSTILTTSTPNHYTTDVVFHDLPYSRRVRQTFTPPMSFSTIYHTHDEYAKPLHHRCRFPRSTILTTSTPNLYTTDVVFHDLPYSRRVRQTITPPMSFSTIYHTHDEYAKPLHHRCRFPRSTILTTSTPNLYTTDVVFHDLPYSRRVRYTTDVVFHDLPYSRRVRQTITPPMSFSTIYHTHDEYAKPLHHRCRFPRSTILTTSTPNHYTTDVVFHDLPYSRRVRQTITPPMSFSTSTILTTSWPPMSFSRSTILTTSLHHRCRFKTHTKGYECKLIIL